MMANPPEHHQSPSPAQPTGYEPKDASVRVIGITVAILSGGIAMSLAASAWLYLAVYSQTAADGARQTSFAEGWRQKTSIEQDQAELQRDVAAHLGSVGWADPEKKRVRIPIEQAMEQMAQGSAQKTKQAKTEGKP